MNTVPIVRAIRGSLAENLHFASAVVCSTTGKVDQMFPNSRSECVYLRSAAKPFQAFPLYQNPKSKDITLPEWAIICASHAASQSQLDLVYQILKKAEANVKDLQCGPHPPMDETMAKQLLCSGIHPTALHNNCSGKHAGMLLACRRYGWPLETYLNPAHPLQQAILKTLEAYSGTHQIQLGIDGCGAPVFCMPLENIARLFAQLATQPEFDTIFKAMTRFPELVGDTHRIDTHLMQISEGNLVAKVGAEGLLGIGNHSREQGIALKIHDGNNAVRDRLAIAVLEDLEWFTPAQAEKLWAQPEFTRNRLNTQDKIVGHYEITLPWQTAASH